MIDNFIYKFFEAIDNFALKLDSIFYAGYKKFRSLFKSKRKRK
jgi:hypothetical protein